MTHNEKLAYIAGLVDGEGYIGIKKDSVKGRGVSPVYYGRLSIAGTNKEMIDLIANFFNCGKIYLHKHSKLSKQSYWSWEVSNLMAENVIIQLYPYLLIKSPEADLFLELAQHKQKKYLVLPKDVIEYREKLYQAVKTLHTFIPS
jgi:hypothetical protein